MEPTIHMEIARIRIDEHVSDAGTRSSSEERAVPSSSSSWWPDVPSVTNDTRAGPCVRP
jgi:hypothetical protein